MANLNGKASSINYCVPNIFFLKLLCPEGVLNIIIKMGDEKAMILSVSFEDLMISESERQKIITKVSTR